MNRTKNLVVTLTMVLTSMLVSMLQGLAPFRNAITVRAHLAKYNEKQFQRLIIQLPTLEKTAVKSLIQNGGARLRPEPRSQKRGLIGRGC